ncbi:MAG TPA: hypothetical protein VGJ70_05610 [Solirubrobacteraceae bacterium]
MRVALPDGQRSADGVRARLRGQDDRPGDGRRGRVLRPMRPAVIVMYARLVPAADDERQ